ncbi:hypothetical protein FRB90_007102 [Tulasnella sp. 427]|nr:hypothetical protein FRB90_007102 [Tulasnella sp. 427]
MSSTEIRVSTTFFPAAILPNVPGGGRTDLIIHTADTVFFYAHQSVLRARSYNSFGLLLATPHHSPIGTSPARRHLRDREENMGNLNNMPNVTSHPLPAMGDQPDTIPTIFVSEYSVVFNLVLHLIYGMPCGRYGPSIDVIARALEALPRYGIPAPEPSNELWTILLQQAKVDPLRVYALGAAHAVDMVCIESSEHTLNTPLSNLSEADAMMMGALYLRRLFFLHFGRTEAFKRIVGPPPETHVGTPSCSEMTQRSVKKSWRVVLADLLETEMPQATSVLAIVSAFGPIANSTQCMACKERIQDRIAVAVRDWEKVKKVI